MTQKLKKDDIRSGYLVKLRDNSFRMVIRAGSFTKILIAEDGSWNYLGSGWDSELKASNTYKNCHLEGILHEPVHDIVAVYGLIRGTEHYNKALCFSPEHRELLWKRPEPVCMTLQQICEHLGVDSLVIVSE